MPGHRQGHSRCPLAMLRRRRIERIHAASSSVFFRNPWADIFERPWGNQCHSTRKGSPSETFGCSLAVVPIRSAGTARAVTLPLCAKVLGSYLAGAKGSTGAERAPDVLHYVLRGRASCEATWRDRDLSACVFVCEPRRRLLLYAFCQPNVNRMAACRHTISLSTPCALVVHSRPGMPRTPFNTRAARAVISGRRSFMFACVRQVAAQSVLQQTLVVEFQIVNQQCEECQKSFTPHAWSSIVQVRQQLGARVCGGRRGSSDPAAPSNTVLSGKPPLAFDPMVAAVCFPPHGGGGRGFLGSTTVRIPSASTAASASAGASACAVSMRRRWGVRHRRRQPRKQ